MLPDVKLYLPDYHISVNDTHRTMNHKTQLPLETETLGKYNFIESHRWELEGNLEISLVKIHIFEIRKMKPR